MTALPSAAETLWFLNSRLTVRRSSTDGPDCVFLAEHWLPHGDSPPMHRHDRQDEVFHVVSGALRLQVGDQTFELTAGQTAVAPKGVTHGFKVISPEGARLINMTVGPDFEALVRATSRPAAGEGLPEPQVPTPAMQAELACIAERHHIPLVGPPMN